MAVWRGKILGKTAGRGEIIRKHPIKLFKHEQLKKYIIGYCASLLMSSQS